MTIDKTPDKNKPAKKKVTTNDIVRALLKPAMDKGDLKAQGLFERLVSKDFTPELMDKLDRQANPTDKDTQR